MLSPIKTVFIYYPFRAFVTITLLIIVSAVAFRTINKKYKRNEITKQNSVCLWVLISYSLVLLFFTVLGRRSWDYYRYNFEIGYSYLQALEFADIDLTFQIIINIIVFIPVGVLSVMSFKRYIFFKGTIMGVLLSIFIESLQFVFRRGYCEIDDVISNALGTIIGCLIVHVVSKKFI